MLLDLVIATSSVVGGFAFGRIYRSIGTYTLPEDAIDLVKFESDGIDTSASQEKVTEVAERLKEHAESMAAKVDAHQLKMKEMNNSLVENESASSDDVMGVVNELIDANKEMQRQLNDAQNRIHEQSMELESVELLAQTDALTRIPNRRAFDERMAEQLAKGPGHKSSFALLDVDHFKRFNDNYGHLAGDEVLRVVAGIVDSRLSQYGMVARYGGEEFAAIFDGVPDDEVQRLVEETRVAISQRETEFENKSFCVTASFGIARLGDESTVEDWIKRADVGLYASKEAGRNCSHWMDNDQPVPVAGGDSAAPAMDDDIASDQAGKSEESGNAEESEAVDAIDVDTEPTESEQDVPAAFAELSNRLALCEELNSSIDRTQTDASVCVMAIRNHEEDNESAMNSLLPVVRSTLRAVDQLGYCDPSTLLIGMPSVDEEIAYDRGHQICRAAATIGASSGGQCKRPVTVGIAKASAELEFDDAIERAIELAQDGLDDENQAVCMENQPVSAN